MVSWLFYHFPHHTFSNSTKHPTIRCSRRLSIYIVHIGHEASLCTPHCLWPCTTVSCLPYSSNSSILFLSFCSFLSLRSFYFSSTPLVCISYLYKALRTFSGDEARVSCQPFTTVSLLAYSKSSHLLLLSFQTFLSLHSSSCSNLYVICIQACFHISWPFC